MRFVFLTILLVACLWLGVEFIGTSHAHSAAKAEFQDVTGQLSVVNQQIKDVKQKINALENNPLAIERIAREQYGWCRKGEEIYQFDNTKEWN